MPIEVKRGQVWIRTPLGAPEHTSVHVVIGFIGNGSVFTHAMTLTGVDLGNCYTWAGDLNGENTSIRWLIAYDPSWPGMGATLPPAESSAPAVSRFERELEV